MAYDHENVNPELIPQPGTPDDKTGDDGKTPLGLNVEQPQVDVSKIATSVDDQKKLWQIKQ